ncbi:acyl-CoA-binding protein (ACBP)/diazepam binding inhibitor (DBI)/endozepine (EP) [Neophaeococcomyces mojaviensis]|uniref:Acyl-CoA-binding protein (ACBP)/diazepam binding inhibitor (DBI)/endozepine (EP) n=1 Tax=Neophaeococcomyces mojaviensis TaxID=3383035 RepID=A0ACC3A091_9EURO|nr:acyl-CoA-binding protein (ACBP)/diazepam binding inhibitor (DBI)/endozepine (EP) [Knufia sp. JES_112]
MPGQAFKDAVKESKQLKAKPGQDELLQVLYYVFLQGPMLLICEFAERTKTHIMYSYFKQAQQDPPIDKAPAPGTFDLKGKAKKKAWQKIVDEGVTPQQAEQKYVALVNELKDKYGYDPNKVAEEVGGS